MNRITQNATIGRMARKTRSPRTADRHKSETRMFRIPMAWANLLDELADEEMSGSTTEQLKNAVREYLQKKGKLPKRE